MDALLLVLVVGAGADRGFAVSVASREERGEAGQGSPPGA